VLLCLLRTLFNREDVWGCEEDTCILLKMQGELLYTYGEVNRCFQLCSGVYKADFCYSGKGIVMGWAGGLSQHECLLSVLSMLFVVCGKTWIRIVLERRGIEVLGSIVVVTRGSIRSMAVMED
jgi:hypothetical protein